MSIEDIERQVQEEKAKKDKTNEAVLKLTSEIEKLQVLNETLISSLNTVKSIKPEFGDDSLRTLKNVLESLKNVPKSVIVKHEKQLNFTNITKRFLLIYVIVSFVVVAASGFTAFYFYNQSQKAEVTGAINFRNYLIKNMPENSAKWIEENTPAK